MLEDLAAQVHTERQVAVALAAAGGWPEDEPWPTPAAARLAFLEQLHTMPEPPQPPDPPSAEDGEQLELLRALGVGRGRR